MYRRRSKFLGFLLSAYDHHYRNVPWQIEKSVIQSPEADIPHPRRREAEAQTPALRRHPLWLEATNEREPP